MSDLLKRVIVGVIGIPIGLGIIYIGGIVFTIALAILSSIALWEYYSLFSTKNYHPYKFFGIVLNNVLIFGFYLIHSLSKFKYDFFLFLFFILCTVIILLSVGIISKRANSLINFAATLSGLIYVTFAFLTLNFIREFDLFFEWIQGNFFEVYSGVGEVGFFENIDSVWAAKLTIIMISSIWISDSFAYFVGIKFGKHKILPSVSPKKSWEGFFGGFIGAIIGFTVLGNLLLPKIPLIHFFIMGLIVAVFGQIGDFAESKLKRDSGIKDSSSILPGHGGILDRFDSLMFISPLIFIYLILNIFLK
ncbi:MAG: phosphatidate cytidylyltransferase [Candidatus Kapabacteria bacterium]|nr:phosphatidate cytidylyltransferase [Candidatus Kapabacteria bacterium]